MSRATSVAGGIPRLRPAIALVMTDIPLPPTKPTEYTGRGVGSSSRLSGEVRKGAGARPFGSGARTRTARSAGLLAEFLAGVGVVRVELEGPLEGTLGVVGVAAGAAALVGLAEPVVGVGARGR